MSWQEEHAGEIAEYEMRLEEREKLLQDKCWKTRDGRVLKISDMTEFHLQNALAFLEQTERDSPFIELFKEQLKDQSWLEPY